nr:MAG TPA: hypothetical protein [Caudoviricetes sp.]
MYTKKWKEGTYFITGIYSSVSKTVDCYSR